MLVEVPYQVRCHYVFKNLAEYTGEGDWSVICSLQQIAGDDLSPLLKID